VVVAEKKKAVQGKFKEIIGNYNPTLQPKTLVIDKERALFWMKNGAQASDTVHNLMCDLGILSKEDKIKKVYGKKLSKKAIKAGGENVASTAPTAEVTEDKPAAETPEETPVEAETPEENSPEESSKNDAEPEDTADQK